MLANPNAPGAATDCGSPAIHLAVIRRSMRQPGKARPGRGRKAAGTPEIHPVPESGSPAVRFRAGWTVIYRNMNRTRAAVPLLAAMALALSACDNAPATLPYVSGAKVDCGGKQTLAASGSTAQAHAMTRFVSAYHKACPDQTLNYNANGSGAGITEFLSGKTDFAGSDTPLSAEQYAAAKVRCGGADAWNLPVVFGPLAITYNLANVDTLVLDGPTLAKIFNGTITRWDDPALTALNASMPAEEIRVVYRNDASGTTENFQSYLQAASGGSGSKARVRSSTATSASAPPATRALRSWSDPPKARSAITNCPSPSSKACTPPRSRRRPAAGRCGRYGSAPTRWARPSPPPRSSEPATTWCSTSRRSTTPPTPTCTPSSWPPTRSCAPDTPAEVAQAVKAFLQAAIGPGQVDLNKSGYIPLSPAFQARVSEAVDAISAVGGSIPSD